MSLTYRPATVDDLTSCLDSLRHHYGNAPDVIPHLPEVWRRLLAAGAIIAPVLEDRTCPPESWILSLGATVFLTDRFLAEAKSGDAPFVSGRIVRQILRGDSPVLSLEEMRCANRTDGLNLCVLHNDHRRPSRNIHPDPRVREKHIEMFFHFQRGYQIKEFLQEVYGQDAIQWMVTSGLDLRTDYADYYHRRPESRPAPEYHPYLAGLSRQEAQALSGSRAYPMFVYLSPRFHLTEREQDLLRRAVAGETDEELADSLYLSVSAIKKRWVVIYDRVMDTAPEVLATSMDTCSVEGRRGTERRRHLLNYLREPIEELQPVNAPGRLAPRG